MISFPAFRPVWTFLIRHRLGLLMILLALIAVAGFWSWWRPPQPRATWQIVNAGSGCNLTSDGRILYGLSQTEIRTSNGSQREGPVGPVRLWDAVTGEERLRILKEGDHLASAGVSPDGRWLAVADRQGGLAVWEVATGRQHAVLTPFLVGNNATEIFRHFVFSPDGQRHAVLEPFPEGNNATEIFRYFLFSPDSRLLAQERADGKGIVLWDIAASRPHAHLEGAHWPCEFSPDGRTLATAAEGKAGLWDVATGQERARLQHLPAPIHSLAFSPDGRLLATDHFDPKRGFMEVNVWQVASGHLYANLSLTRGSPDYPVYVRPLKFSPDSRMLMMSSIGGAVSSVGRFHRAANILTTADRSA